MSLHTYTLTGGSSAPKHDIHDHESPIFNPNVFSLKK